MGSSDKDEGLVIGKGRGKDKDKEKEKEKKTEKSRGGRAFFVKNGKFLGESITYP